MLAVTSPLSRDATDSAPAPDQPPFAFLRSRISRFQAGILGLSCPGSWQRTRRSPPDIVGETGFIGVRVKPNNLSPYLQRLFLFVLVHHCSRINVSCMIIMCQSTDPTPPSVRDVSFSSRGDTSFGHFDMRHTFVLTYAPPPTFYYCED